MTSKTWQTTCRYCRYIRSALVLIYYILAAYGLFMLLIWLADSAPVAVFAQGRMDISEVKPGSAFVVYQPIRKLRDCDGEVYRYISGECGVMPIWSGKTTVRQGFAGNLILPIELPRQARTGQCEFRSKIHYFCNPLDFIFDWRVVETPPIYFRVVE